LVGNRKAETKHHSVLKHVLASVLEKQGHEIVIEQMLGIKSGIIDVMDWTDGLAYEIQSGKIKKQEAEKLEKYLKYTGIKDVIFIYTKDFPLELPCTKLYKLIQEKLGL